MKVLFCLLICVAIALKTLAVLKGSSAHDEHSQLRQQPPSVWQFNWHQRYTNQQPLPHRQPQPQPPPSSNGQIQPSVLQRVPQARPHQSTGSGHTGQPHQNLQQSIGVNLPQPVYRIRWNGHPEPQLPKGIKPEVSEDIMATIELLCNRMTSLEANVDQLRSEIGGKIFDIRQGMQRNATYFDHLVQNALNTHKLEISARVNDLRAELDKVVTLTKEQTAYLYYLIVQISSDLSNPFTV